MKQKVKISQVKLNVNVTGEEITNQLRKKICHLLKISPEEILDLEIIKRSLDARKKPLTYSYQVEITTNAKKLYMKSPDIVMIQDNQYNFSDYVSKNSANTTSSLHKRPVIIGAGPAGLFCTLMLANAGFEPVLLERGETVAKRTSSVNAFWDGKPLNPSSNVQFGEGGAGTFSDGKLTTLVKDPVGRSRFVLETFVKAGASEEILYDAKPHIGTDVLQDVVVNLRKSMEQAGARICFESQVTDFRIENNSLTMLEVNHSEKIPVFVTVLAIGHSARDTFARLHEKHVPMEAKSFAVGVRITHPQSLINIRQYGEGYPSVLPAASYKLTGKTSVNRGVYSFCMCPGGYVVNASSEENLLAVNGMSNYNRDSKTANSAIVVGVTPKDYENKGVLGGVEFQRMLERAAYQAGNGCIPVQRFEDFCLNHPRMDLGDLIPESKGKCSYGDVRNIFPMEIAKALEEGIKGFDRKIPGFANPDVLLYGVESRTSSPVRITRDSVMESEISGLYPCGEGAGYAGGIMSAAMDGIKIAEAIAMKYKPCYD